MFKSLLALVFAFACVSAHADTMTSPQWEISGGSDAFYSHTNTGGTGTHDWQVNGQAGYFFMPQWEVAVNLGINLQGGDSSSKTWNLLAGLVYNFNADIVNSIFVEALAGIDLHGNGANEDNYNQFSYHAGVGKRFALTSSVSYKPEIEFVGKGTGSVNGVTYSSSYTTWEIIPLQFSFVL